MSSLVASLAALIPEMSAQEELSLMTKGAWAMIVCGVMAALALLTKHSAPYGRYAESASGLWGCSINGRLAWVLQEAPCLVAAALCIVSGEREREIGERNTVREKRDALSSQYAKT